MNRVYLDNNATSPVLPEIYEAMQPYFFRSYGNASSIHTSGQEARAAVDQARESVAELLGCRASEIVFTGGGTESDNSAIFGLVCPGDHVITSAIEHHAILHTCEQLHLMGCEFTCVPVDGNGVVDPDEVRRALRPDTRLITIMMANNETGVVQPVEEIGKIAAEADVYFHTDAVQAVAKVPVAVDRIGCDLLSLSGHKFHAPKGIGALYIRKGTLLRPMLFGGSQERSRRAGTENVPAIVGLGKAAELAQKSFEDGSITRMAALRDHLEQELLANVESAEINGRSAPRVPNTTNLYFDCTEGEAMVIALDLKGLAVSSGAACSSGAVEPSHVLTAMELPAEKARASIRLSLGKQNTAEDVDFALGVIPETVARLRELSPVYKKTAISN